MAISLEVQGKLLGQPSMEYLEKSDFANALEKHLQEIFEVDLYARELNVPKEKFYLADFPNSKNESISKPGGYGKNDCNLPKNQRRGYHHRHVLYGGICQHQRQKCSCSKLPGFGAKEEKDPKSINGPVAMKKQGFADLHLYAQCPGKGESFILNVHPKWHNPLGQVASIDWYRRLFDQMPKNGEIKSVQVFENLGLVYNNYEDLEEFRFYSKSLWSRIISYCYPRDEYFGENMHEAMTEHAKDNFFIRLCNEKPDSIPEVGKLSVVPMARTQESFFHFCANKDKILEFSTQRHMEYSSQVIIKAVADAQKKYKKNHENTKAPLDSVSNPPVSSFQHFEITFKKCPLLKLIFF